VLGVQLTLQGHDKHLLQWLCELYTLPLPGFSLLPLFFSHLHILSERFRAQIQEVKQLRIKFSAFEPVRVDAILLVRQHFCNLLSEVVFEQRYVFWRFNLVKDCEQVEF